MLVRFSIKNFRTFKDQATLSMVASNLDNDMRVDENIQENKTHGLRLLRSAVIYGPNASGKSKLIDALAFMRHFVINSSKGSQQGDPIDVHPFKLSSETIHEPSEFEIMFIHEDVVYRYGFEASRDRVLAEWLFYKPKTKEIELFYREGQSFDTHDRNFSKGRTVIREGLIRDNALLVSVAAQFNDNIAIQVVEWFKKLRALSGLNEDGYQGYTMGKTEDIGHKANILNLLKAADLGIQDIQLQKFDIERLPQNMPAELRNKIVNKVKEENAELVSDVLTFHKQYDANKTAVGQVTFSLDEDESSGTRKFFALTGPILDVLENGHTLFVDELDSKLHPNLVCELVALFNSKELNKKNAQLIFNTHDTNLLSSGLFRRDQIWFTEKNKYGEAKLYSLADFRSDQVRKSERFEDNYVRGKYGAIPYLGHFNYLNDLIFKYGEEEQEG